MVRGLLTGAPEWMRVVFENGSRARDGQKTDATKDRHKLVWRRRNKYARNIFFHWLS